MREITLIGQDTTCYGEDLGLKDGLALLLEKLANIPDLRWIRFLYAYPNKITGRSIEKMRKTIPNLALRTSFIVGFPGETEQEFEELCDFVREARFDWMGAFGYSDEEGAAAHHLEKKVSSREIERRRKQLMQIQQKISKRAKKALIGRRFDLLLEGTSDETDLLLEGRTVMHAPEIDGKVFVNDVPEGQEVLPGEFYPCEVTEAHDYDLVAKIL